MSSQDKENVVRHAPPKKAMKAWKKPVLDILDLKSAAYGPHNYVTDGPGKHQSH